MWRVIRLVVGGGTVIVLAVAALMAWPLLWPPDPDAAVRMVSGRLLGETTGYVGRVNRDAQTFDVSASLIGLRPVALEVNADTAIVVHGRQGGFGDLLNDLPVRVTYEVAGDRRLAKSIEVVTGRPESPTEASLSPATLHPALPTSPVPSAPSPRPANDTPASTGAAVTGPVPVMPPAPARPAPRATPVPSATSAPSPAPAAAARPTATPTSTPAATSQPAAKPAPASAPAPAAAPAPVAAPPSLDKSPPLPPAAARLDPAAAPSPRTILPRVETSVPIPAAGSRRPDPDAPVRVQAPSRPADSDPGDGAAAVEWLLNRSR